MKPDDKPMGFDDKIELACELTSWPLTVLAKRAGVKATSLQTAVERGRPMKWPSSVKLAQALFVDVQWLMDETKGLADLTERPWWLVQGDTRKVSMKGVGAKLGPESQTEAPKRKHGRTA